MGWTQMQQSAIDTRDRSLLVSAAAGSGKTAVLTERIIQSLLQPTNPLSLDRILVVTFSCAAAAEMKGKIAKKLAEKNLSSQLLLLNSAQISTIDSFFQKTVRENFLKANVPSGFRIASEEEVLPLKQRIFEETIDDFYKKYQTNHTKDLFARIDQNDFSRMMIHLMENYDDGGVLKKLTNFSKLFEKDPNGFESLKQSQMVLKSSIGKDFLVTPYGRLLLKEITTWANGILEILEGYENESKYDATFQISETNKRLQADLNFFRRLKDVTSKQPTYKDLQNCFNSFEDKPNLTFKNVNVSYENEYKFLRNSFKAVKKKYDVFFDYSQEEVQFQTEELSFLSSMLYEFLTEFQKRFFEEKIKRNFLEFNDVRALCYRLLYDENGNKTDLANEIADQYDAVYIDEYQDVDKIQDKIFQAIGKDHLFLVGDIKQSIYGFRGSVPELFLGYRKLWKNFDAAQSPEPMKIFMSSNFRCNKNIVDFSNLVCGTLFEICKESIDYSPASDDLNFGKEVEPTQQDHKVQVHVFEKVQPADKDTYLENSEANYVADEIVRLLNSETLDLTKEDVKKQRQPRKLQPKDIAILVRKNKNAAPIIEELKKRNVPVYCENESDFSSSSLFVLMHNFLRIVNNPHEDIPLSELLMSSCFGFSMNDLIAIRKKLPEPASLYDAMLSFAHDENVSVDENITPQLKSRLQSFLAFYEEEQHLATTLSVDRFLRKTYSDEHFRAYDGDPVLVYFYDQALSFTQSSFCGLYNFIERFEKNMETGEKVKSLTKAQNAVTITSIHKSKGLEYPVLFLPFLGQAYTNSSNNTSLDFQRDIGFSSKLFDEGSGKLEDTLFFHCSGIAADVKEAEEEVRLLYVALTRARERLYLTGTFGKKTENAQPYPLKDYSLFTAEKNYLTWVLSALHAKKIQNASYTLSYDPLYLQETYQMVMYQGEDALKNGNEESYLQEYANVSPTLQTSFENVPTTIPASSISNNYLDYLDNGLSEEVLMNSVKSLQRKEMTFESLLQARNKPTAAEKGTAMHSFLEFVHYETLQEENGLEKELQRMETKRFLDKDRIALLDQKQLELLKESNLSAKVLQAKEIQRERTFSFLYDTKAFTQNDEKKERLKDQKVMVVGSIDMLLKDSNDAYILIDYKTDSIPEEISCNEDLLQKTLMESHGNQLSCYAYAVSLLYGKEPKEIYIYSTRLGRLIPMINVPKFNK